MLKGLKTAFGSKAGEQSPAGPARQIETITAALAPLSKRDVKAFDRIVALNREIGRICVEFPAVRRALDEILAEQPAITATQGLDALIRG